MGNTVTTQDQTLQELKQGLVESRARLLQALSGVTEEQFKRRPPTEAGEPAFWSIAEVLAYLLASDRLSNQRIALALEEDGAAIASSEPEDVEAMARAGRLAPVPQLIHGLLAARRELELLLGQAGSLQDGLERVFLHPQLGRRSVATTVREQVLERENQRVAQIEVLRSQVGAASRPGKV
jgi:hypothetical protein